LRTQYRNRTARNELRKICGSSKQIEKNRISGRIKYICRSDVSTHALYHICLSLSTEQSAPAYPWGIFGFKICALCAREYIGTISSKWEFQLLFFNNLSVMWLRLLYNILAYFPGVARVFIYPNLIVICVPSLADNFYAPWRNITHSSADLHTFFFYIDIGLQHLVCGIEYKLR
jgi:hypothetical protein